MGEPVAGNLIYNGAYGSPAGRGSSLVLALSFLPEFDFARSQLRFREFYRVPVLDFVLVREYPRVVKGLEDVDSEPLIFGVSPFASGVDLAEQACRGGHEESRARLR